VASGKVDLAPELVRNGLFLKIEKNIFPVKKTI
jgi:hypothetical protein